MSSDQAHRPFAIKAIRLILSISIGCGLLGVLCLVELTILGGMMFRATWPTEDYRASRADRRTYGSLTPGISRAEAEQMFGRSPDYECQFRNYMVLYFIDPSQVEAGRIDILTYSFPDVVEAKEELPYVYGAKQVLLDADGKVVAYTWIGEELRIHTRLKEYPGAAIQELPHEFFKSLNSPE